MDVNRTRVTHFEVEAKNLSGFDRWRLSVVSVPHVATPKNTGKKDFRMKK